MAFDAALLGMTRQARRRCPKRLLAVVVEEVDALVTNRCLERSRNGERPRVAAQGLNRGLLGSIHVTVETILPCVARGAALCDAFTVGSARGYSVLAACAKTVIIV
jgi:hypothetical protein